MNSAQGEAERKEVSSGKTEPILFGREKSWEHSPVFVILILSHVEWLDDE